MNIETSVIINHPHITLDEWLRDSLRVLGLVSNAVTGACISGDTEEANAELRKLAPDVQELAKSFTDLTKPKETKTDVKAELAKLRAAFGMPDHIKPAPQGIERDALSDELGNIASMLGELDPRLSPLSSRLFVLSNRIAREGVYVDESLPF